MVKSTHRFRGKLHSQAVTWVQNPKRDKGVFDIG